eukprot:CAMPEP_0172445144 /NCGR_PEP_ID=MMETSP1065-20121228/5075_1 /TAXON_ID=265537 /ORGANISM="Amphiprora paludosa, Strain CCMP125" /LENGTH=793 /DNA_ID=CAMNT_0013195941 /DNA_START=75 /DNA_END=2456 /DNA_ORIENTATION=-
MAATTAAVAPTGETAGVSPEANIKSEEIPDAAASAEDNIMSEKDQEAESRGREILRTLVLPQIAMPPPAEYEPIEKFVSKAMQDQHECGKETPTQAYAAVLDCLSKKRDLQMLRNILLALRTSGRGNTIHYLIMPQFRRLVHLLLKMDPFKLPGASGAITTRADYDVADALFHLHTAIVSANSAYVKQTLECLWRMMVYDPSPIEKTSRIHAAIATVLRLCPSGKDEMIDIIESKWPHRTADKQRLITNAKQVLLVTGYIPDIQNQLVEMLIDRCLELDVEIKISDNGEVSVDKEVDDNDEDDEGETPKEGKIPVRQKKKKVQHGMTVDEMATKLDSLMYIFFEFIESRKDTRSNLFHGLMYGFCRSILYTHKSKFVQFVMLHICGLDFRERIKKRMGNDFNDNVDLFAYDDDEEEDEEDDVPLYHMFASKLIEMVLADQKTPQHRQMAISYLASFVCRAGFLDRQTVCEAVSALFRIAESYMDGLDSTTYIYSPDLKSLGEKHALFYTVCQAAFYIMCFRGKDAMAYYRQQCVLLDEGEIDQNDFAAIDIGTARWRRICFYRLSPLDHCLASVKEEFLEAATVLGVLDAQTIEQLAHANKQQKRPRKRAKAISIPTMMTLQKERKTGGVGGLGKGDNPLGTFFPFDPYLLRHSYAFIEPFYNHWKGTITPEDLLVEDVDKEGEEFEEGTAVSTDPDVDPYNSNYEQGEAEDDVSDDGDDEISDGSDSDDDDVDVEQNEFRAVVDADIDNPRELTHQVSAPSLTTVKTHEELKDAWSKTLKRSRAPSIENGSW